MVALRVSLEAQEDGHHAEASAACMEALRMMRERRPSYAGDWRSKSACLRRR